MSNSSAHPDHIADANKKVQPAPAPPVEIFSVVTCGECKRIWVGYSGCLTEPLPCGHMRSQWAVGSTVVDDMLSALSTRQKNMEEDEDDDY